MKQTSHSKKQLGFGTIEVMLALVLAAGVIVILMKSVSSSSEYTNAKGLARGYAVLVNDVLSQFADEVSTCQGASSKSDCSLTTTGGENSYEYLSGTMSDSAESKLQAVGIDPTQVTVEVCWARLDDDC